MVNLTYVGLLVSRNLVLLWRVFILWKNVGVFLKLKQIKSKYKSQVPFNLNYLEKPGMSTNFNWRTESVFYPLVCSLHCTLSLYFTPWSAVHIVPSVCILHPGLQSTLYPQSAFYSRFAICVLNWPVLHRLNAGHSEIFIEFPPQGFFKLLENKCRVVLCKRRCTSYSCQYS